MAGECPSPVLGGGLPAAVVKRAKVIAPLQGASFNDLNRDGKKPLEMKVAATGHLVHLGGFHLLYTN